MCICLCAFPVYSPLSYTYITCKNATCLLEQMSVPSRINNITTYLMWRDNKCTSAYLNPVLINFYCCSLSGCVHPYLTRKSKHQFKPSGGSVTWCDASSPKFIQNITQCLQSASPGNLFLLLSCSGRWWPGSRLPPNLFVEKLARCLGVHQRSLQASPPQRLTSALPLFPAVLAVPVE